MNALSVIIPSKTISNLLSCMRAIREHEPALSICVIDDGLGLSDVDRQYAVYSQASVVKGAKPFIFARNVNLGILAAGRDDVILLNDDALLRSDEGFSRMKSCLAANQEYGILSAVTNVAGNPEQRPRGMGLRDAGSHPVAFVCVLIPRRTIDAVGLLDERFGGKDAQGRELYGWEDNDYCRRVRAAGLKVGIYDGCYVDHGSLRSTFRGDPLAAADIRPSAEVYRQKWGDLA